MSYDVNHKQSFNHPAEMVSQSASQLLETLGGKTSQQSDPAKGLLEANFNKKVKSTMLVNRCQLKVKVVAQSPDSCNVLAKAYPVDPMGNKLAFGVRGNAAQVVIDTFFDELKTQLGN